MNTTILVNPTTLSHLHHTLIFHILKKSSRGKSAVNQIAIEAILWNGIKKYVHRNASIHWEKYNKAEGRYKSWYMNGQIATECFYSEGKREGPHKYWGGSGQLYIECFYKKDKLNGYCKLWGDDGKIKSEDFYIDGTRF